MPMFRKAGSSVVPMKLGNPQDVQLLGGLFFFIGCSSNFMDHLSALSRSNNSVGEKPYYINVLVDELFRLSA